MAVMDPSTTRPVPRTLLGWCALALAAVYAVAGGVLLANGPSGADLAPVVYGGCVVAVAVLAFVEAALAFGSHTVERSARLRGACALLLICVIGVWGLGAVWLVATAVGGGGGLAWALSYAGTVLPLVLVATGNVLAANRSVRLRSGGRSW